MKCCISTQRHIYSRLQLYPKSRSHQRIAQLRNKLTGAARVEPRRHINNTTACIFTLNIMTEKVRKRLENSMEKVIKV